MKSLGLPAELEFQIIKARFNSQYSTDLSYTAVQHRSYCITVLAVRILLYELYSTVLYCTTSIGHANEEFSVCILI